MQFPGQLGPDGGIAVIAKPNVVKVKTVRKIDE
jgi:hypothetical protein